MKRRIIRGHGKNYGHLAERVLIAVYWGKDTHQYEERNRTRSQRGDRTPSPAMQTEHTFGQATPSANTTCQAHTDVSGAQNGDQCIPDHCEIPSGAGLSPCTERCCAVHRTWSQQKTFIQEEGLH